jgi:hypothetical protein
MNPVDTRENTINTDMDAVSLTGDQYYGNIAG